jgi:hypothetical protein
MFLWEVPLDTVKNRLMYIEKLFAELHNNKTFQNKMTMLII